MSAIHRTKFTSFTADMKFQMLLRLLAPLCLGVALCAQVNPPWLGYARFADHTLRPVYGLPSSFIVGQPALNSVDSASFCDRGGVVSTPGHIRVFDLAGSPVGDYTSTEPHPVLNIGRKLSTAMAWLPAAQQILRFDGSSFVMTPVPVSLPGPVTSIHLSGETADLLVNEAGAVAEVKLSLANGNIVSERLLPGVKAPAVYFSNFVVFRNGQDLEIQPADGVPNGPSQSVRLPSGVALSLEHMSDRYLHLIAKSGQHWALHVDGSLHLSELPAAPKTTAPAAAVLVRGEE
jgi:hypothetical protein